MTSSDIWEELLDGDKLVIDVTKFGAVMPVSTGTLMDEGLIPDTRAARPRRAPARVTSWTLARSRVGEVVAAVRLRAGSWIAGVDLTGQDDAAEEWT